MAAVVAVDGVLAAACGGRRQGMAALAALINLRLYQESWERYMEGRRKRKCSGISMALLLACALVSGPAVAASVVGVLVGGGGIDDMRVEVRDAKGRIITAYCLDRCGNIFGEPDANEVVKVQNRYRNRKVKLDYDSEMNKDRIAGAGEERLDFVKKLEVLP